MAFTLLQVGSNLKTVNTDGFPSSTLTLPTGVTLATNLTPRFTKFTMGLRTYIVLVNTPNFPISIDDLGVTRFLTPPAPTSAVVLSAGASGTLTGTYLSLQAYFIKDTNGNIIALSDYGPAETSATSITNQKLHAAYNVSPFPVTGTRLYRTTTNGATYFTWHDVNDNTTTSYEGDESDASLGTVAAPNLGPAPDLTLVATWNGRLWGVDRQDVDHLRYTESGTMYAWSLLNSIPIGRIGSDKAGITALIPRRNYLGVTRKDQFLQISGNSNSNFTQISLEEGVGCDSQESVVVYKDVAYFLWHDGVYTWDDTGIKCITNGKIRSWFTNDDTFNRAMFWRSFASLDPITLRYRLFLASAGSSVIDSWIEYDLTTGAWWGPHFTTAFDPTCAVEVYGANQKYYSMIGSSQGILSQDQEIRKDWEDSIDWKVTSKTFDSGEPDVEKYFGELSVNGPAQSTGTVTVTAAVGELDNAPSSTLTSWDLTKGRQRLDRLGVGKAAQLTFENNEREQDVIQYGYEINPVATVGRR